MRNPYQLKLVVSLKQDWLYCVRSRAWRSKLSEELQVWGKQNPYWGNVDSGLVIGYVNGIVMGEIRSSSNTVLYDNLCWQAARSDLAFGLAVHIQVRDSLNWVVKESGVDGLEDFLSTFMEFVAVELSGKKSLDSVRWTSSNVRRNAQRRTLMKTKLERDKSRLNVSDNGELISELVAEPEACFSSLVEHVSNVSGEPMTNCANAVLYYGYGLTMSELVEVSGTLSFSQLEYSIRKVCKRYKRNLKKFSEF